MRITAAPERVGKAAARTTRIPPSPPAKPVVGHLLDFATDLLGFFTRCAREYGDVVAMRLGRVPAYLISHPDLVEQVLVTEQRNFVKNKDAFFWRHVGAIFGNGLLRSSGDHWLRQRRLAQPAFHRERIAAYGDAMVAHTERMLAGWTPGQTMDVHEHLMHLTLRIVADAIFSSDVGGDVDAVGEALEVLMPEISVRLRRVVRIPDALPLPGNVRYTRAIRQIDAVVYRVIREHHERAAAGRAGHDLLDLLMQARDEDGRGMTDEELRDEVITMILAGHETTALALSWTFLLLGRHPEADAALARELALVLGAGDGARPPRAADLPRLRYTESVVYEAMRLYPPAYVFGRQAVEPCEIGGYDIPAGATIFVSQWVMHRDPRWFEQPDKFAPERWLDGLAQRLPRFAYFPFGGGLRLCIGHRFAMMEATLLLAAIAQRWRLAVEPNLRVGLLPSITLRPVPGVPVTLARRGADEPSTG